MHCSINPSAIFDEMGLVPSFVIQPIFAMTKKRPNLPKPSLRIDGGEILLRLERAPTPPTNTLYLSQPPVTHLGHFFETVSKAKRLNEVDLFAFDTALNLIETHWGILNPYRKRPIKLNINITPQTLLDEQTVNIMIKRLMVNERFAGNLCFELVESYDLSEIDQIAHTLRRLHQLGASVSFDDFGSGFMDLNKLEQANEAGVNIIKVDYLLTSAIASDREKSNYVKRVLDESKRRRISVLAEGVETRAIYNTAIDLGFHYAQGRWLERELPIDVYFDLVLRQSSSRFLLTKPPLALSLLMEREAM